MDTNRDNPNQLPIWQLEQIDEACVAFEAELSRGKNPSIETFLAPFEDCSAKSTLLAELIALEIEYQSLSGSESSRNDYEQRFPNESTAVAAAFETRRMNSQNDNRTPPLEDFRLQSDFQISRYHARGGLGVVYIAKDKQLNRDVAVKFARIGDNDISLRRRFKREAEITGRLQHPGIAPVYAINQDGNSPPHYVMRFVDGETLESAVGRFHDQMDGAFNPNRYLSIKFRQLLQRIVSVCNTVSYAHGKGVIHRDIKPNNIMLGKYGETILLDWGLAKLIGSETGDDTPGAGTSESGHTQDFDATLPGQVLGTPAFAAPEQILGTYDHSERSDVYSIGATLHYALTGKHAVSTDSGSLPGEEDFRGIDAPHRLNAAIPSALSIICCKAMAFEPDQRYSSANDLARDLERYLADEPIDGVQESVVARWRRWSRRNPGRFAGLAATLLVGIAALGVGSVLIGQKNKELGDVNFELKNKNEELTESKMVAERAKNAAVDSLRTVLEDVQQRVYSFQGRLTPDDRAFLQRAVNQFDRLVELEPDQTVSDALRAEVLLRTGDIHFQTGQFEQANESWTQCIEMAGSNAEPSERMAVISARALSARGNLHAKSGRLVDAESDLVNAVERFTEIVDRNDELSYRHGLAIAHTHAAHAYALSLDPEKAEKHYQIATTILGELMTQLPDHSVYRINHARSLAGLGFAMLKLDRPYTEVAAVLKNGLNTIKELRDEAPDVPAVNTQLATTFSYLGELEMRHGNHHSAQQYLKRAIEIVSDLAAHFVDSGLSREMINESAVTLTRLHQKLGHVSLSSGDAKEAEEHFRDAIILAEEAVEENPGITIFERQLRSSHTNLALFFVDRNRKQAVESYRHAHAIAKKHFNEHQTTQNRMALVDVQSALAGALLDVGQRSVAKQLFDDSFLLLESLSAKERQLPRHRKIIVRTNYGLGVYFLYQGELEEAVSYFEVTLKEGAAIRVGGDGGRTESLLRRTRGLRAICLARSQPENALKAVQETQEIGSLSGAELFNLASACALAHEHFVDDHKKKLAADMVMDLLRDANETGYFSSPRQTVAWLNKRSFRSMQDRKEFASFVSNFKGQLETGTASDETKKLK